MKSNQVLNIIPISDPISKPKPTPKAKAKAKAKAKFQSKDEEKKDKKQTEVDKKKEIAKLVKQLEKDNVIDDEMGELLNNIKITNYSKIEGIKDLIIDHYTKIVPEILLNGIDDMLIKLFDDELKNLTSDQKHGVKLLMNFLYGNQSIFGLYGYAGTGKTTTIIEFIFVLLKYQLINSLALTAPTNKATDIIKSKFKRHIDFLCTEDLSFDDKLAWIKKHKKIDIQVITIHKLLNYNNDFNMKGDKVFIKKGKSNISKFDLIIIDECSMIPGGIINDIFEEIRKNNVQITKTVFLGDPAQLPPVNEKMSLIFEQSKNAIYKTVLPQLKEQHNAVLVVTDTDVLTKMDLLYDDLQKTDSFTLSHVVRSTNDNIVNLSNKIREWVLGTEKFPNITQYRGNGVYLYKKSGEKTESKWFKKFLEHSQSDASNIILAWRNIQCDKYNRKFREKMFNSTDLARFVKGDILIINDFYNYDETKTVQTFNKNKSNKFYTSEQVKILDIDIEDYITNGLLEKEFKSIKETNIRTKVIDCINKINEITIKKYKIYKLYVNKLADNNSSERCYINVISDNDIKKLEYDKDISAEYITKLRTYFEKTYKSKIKTLDHDVIKYLWRERDKVFIAPFCNVNYGASISCHKSQASTYHNVFVDADDILLNNNYEECKRCIYTAITRTSNEVHIIL